MRLALLFIFTILLSFPAKGQVLEKYFHELRGMEDSTGTTHLFYRHYERKKFTCPDNNYVVYPNKNNVFHYNSTTDTDSILFNDYFGPWCLYDEYDSESVEDYGFINNDLNKWVITNSAGCNFGLKAYTGSVFNFFLPCITKSNPNTSIFYTSDRLFFFSPNQESMFINPPDREGTITLSSDPNEWPVISNADQYHDFVDSVLFYPILIGVNPALDSLYYARDLFGNLYRSTNYSSHFEIADSSGSHVLTAIDSDSSVIYSVIINKINDRSVATLKRSDSFGEYGSWADLSSPEGLNRIRFMVADLSRNGHLFIADSSYIYFSPDYGDNFELLLAPDDKISGLYKKPDSELLYVLTTDELFELNIESGTTTSLKTLPVSNEPEPKDFPKRVVLHQNYPNPFNPSTNIMYSLPSDTYVELKVYDRLGREIQFLVNEYQTKGYYSVRFRTHDLASGVYFYQLITRDLGEVHSKKMFFIK